MAQCGAMGCEELLCPYLKGQIIGVCGHQRRCKKQHAPRNALEPDDMQKEWNPVGRGIRGEPLSRLLEWLRCLRWPRNTTRSHLQVEPHKVTFGFTLGLGINKRGEHFLTPQTSQRVNFVRELNNI